MVFGGEPGTVESGIPGRRVGYMPQELALYGEFSIKETLEYFGRIYQLPSAFVKSQMDFLFKLLDLPPPHRSVKTLSGGQQRRVSFAVALFHEPDLFILDEPTVGVDPVLRKRLTNKPDSIRFTFYYFFKIPLLFHFTFDLHLSFFFKYYFLFGLFIYHCFLTTHYITTSVFYCSVLCLFSFKRYLIWGIEWLPSLFVFSTDPVFSPSQNISNILCRLLLLSFRVENTRDPP